MVIEPKTPEKVHYLEGFSLSIVKDMCSKTATERFVGGRPGYDRDILFFWLLVKKVTNWDYRTIASMANVSHSTLVRANHTFLVKGVYQKLFVHLVKRGYKEGLIKGEKVALDSSFVQTFSKKEELGSEGYNGHKKAIGFKLHLLIDAETGFPIALVVGNGIAHDSTLAIPLLRKARAWLKRVGYVLADKGYDDTDIVVWIAKELKAQAGIPMRTKSKLAKGKKHKYGNVLNWQLKAQGRTFKKSILHKRIEVERCFSHLKRVYHLGKEEMRGIMNFTGNAYQSLICLMLRKFYLANITF
jgi:transposase